MKTHYRLLLLAFAAMLIATVGSAHADDECADCPMATFTGTYKSLDTLSVEPPDSFLYALIDGAVDTQQFTNLKAKVKSAMSGISVGAGNVWALARYYMNNGYSPNLLTGIPQEQYIAEAPSFSTSAMIPVASLSDQTFTEFAFDFSGSPIPAGIVDLELKVFFKGEVSGYDNEYLLWGTRDLEEPAHLAFLNATDRFYLNDTLYSPVDIQNDPSLWPEVDLNENGTISEYWDGEPVVAESSYRISLGFEGPGYPDAQVYYDVLGPGEYGRLIALWEGDQVNVKLGAFCIDLPDLSSSTELPGFAVTDHWVNVPGTNERNLETTPLQGFRGVVSHWMFFKIRFYLEEGTLPESFFADESWPDGVLIESDAF